MGKILKGGAFMGNFLLQKTKKGFVFGLLAANGQRIAISEVYSSESACRSGIDSVRANAAAPVEDLTAGASRLSNPKYQLYQDNRGLYRFRLKARNGRIIATSQAYRSKGACLEGIDSVRINATDELHQITVSEDSP